MLVSSSLDAVCESCSATVLWEMPSSQVDLSRLSENSRMDASNSTRFARCLFFARRNGGRNGTSSVIFKVFGSSFLLL